MLALAAAVEFARKADQLGEQIADALLTLHTEPAGLTAGVLSRAAQSLRSTVLLASKGLEADAMAVMRTPTEMLIDLIYILQEKTAERMEKFRSYEDIANLKFAKGISLLHDGKVDSLAMRTLEVKADAARRLYGTKPDGGLRKIRDWADNSIDARATAIGLAPIYGTTYRDACAASHSGAATLRYVIEVDDEGTHFRWGPGLPSPKPVALALFGFFGLLRVAFDNFDLATLRPPFDQLEAAVLAGTGATEGGPA